MRAIDHVSITLALYSQDSFAEHIDAVKLITHMA